jgi:hypothetical protein
MLKRSFFISLVLWFAFLSRLEAQLHADCVTAMEICEKKSYRIDHASGEGQDRTEADLIACFMGSENEGQAEENSTWIKFEIEQSGSLHFTITPLRPDDDLDFVVYRLLNGTCNNKKIVRCNAAGDPSDALGLSPCLGKTGLREGEKDSSVDAGCNDPNDNAWLAPLQVVKGEKYMILVSNVSSKGPGFSIQLGGTATLPCDKKKSKQTPPVLLPTKPNPPVVAAPGANQPTSIGGRAVEVGEQIKIKSRTITLKIWDSQVEDGDVVSVYVGEKKVVDHLYLRSKPHEFNLELPVGKEFYITVFADDFGKAEPNTAMVSIFDGVKEQTIDLVAGRKKQESVKIVVE